MARARFNPSVPITYTCASIDILGLSPLAAMTLLTLIRRGASDNEDVRMELNQLAIALEEYGMTCLPAFDRNGQMRVDAIIEVGN